jgi:hypothetical protein
MLYKLKTDLSNHSVRAHYNWLISKGLDPSKPLKALPSSGIHLRLNYKRSDGSFDMALLSRKCFDPYAPVEKDLEGYL